MTICMYHKGALYADRSGFFTAGQHQAVEMKKLQVVANKTLAIAVSGKPLQKDNPAMWQKFIKFLKTQIKISQALNSHIELDKWLTDYLGSRQVLLMTKKGVYMYHPPEARAEDVTRGAFGFHDPDYPAYIGSGTSCASVAITAGKEPMEAMLIAQLCDSMGWISKIDSVTQAELKDY